VAGASVLGLINVILTEAKFLIFYNSIASLVPNEIFLGIFTCNDKFNFIDCVIGKNLILL